MRRRRFNFVWMFKTVRCVELVNQNYFADWEKEKFEGEFLNFRLGEIRVSGETL